MQDGPAPSTRELLDNIHKIAGELAQRPALDGAQISTLMERVHQDILKCASLVNEAAPIAILPPDVLALIFEMIQEVLPSDGQAREFPIKVSQVSRFWRSVALASPFLWASVDVSPPRKTGGIQTYLERSGTHPLELYLNVYPDNKQGSFPKFDIDEFCDIVVPHFSRCRSIEIRGNFEEQSQMLFSLFARMRSLAFPRLERFLVEGKECDEDTYPNQDPYLFTEDAPMLKDVRLGGIGALYCRPSLAATTTLHFAAGTSRIPFASFSKILASCPSLTTLAVYDDLLGDWLGTTMTFDTPLLRSLQIYGNMLSVSELLLSICAPELEELVIAPVVIHDLTILYSHVQKGSPKFPSLKSLTVAPAHPEAFEALELAAVCFPTVELLVLPNIYPREFMATFNKSDSPVLWPHLVAMAFNDIDHKSEHSIHTIVVLRRSLGVPLHSVYLDPISIERMERLDQLKDNIQVVQADLWNVRRKGALYSNEQDRFIGAQYDEDS